MKTIQVSVSLSRAAGGIFEIELALAQQLHAMGVDVEALGLYDPSWENDASRWEPVHARVFKTRGPGALGYAGGLLGEMINSEADVAHLHYMWLYPSIAVSKWAAGTGKPYVVTPNGMLEPWALSNSAWKKKIAGFLYEKRMLHGAACLQANTEKELADFRAFGLKNPVCVIPNGIDLPDIRDQESVVREQETGKKTLLFLGRLHPKKGLLNALKAWTTARDQGSGIRGQEVWQFVIAGWDQGGHEADLKRLCTELEIAWTDIPAAEFVSGSSSLLTAHYSLGTLPSVLFVGPAFGDTKDALLRSASAFILPSFSEGLPMSVLEAWSYQLPVLMTDHCNLPEGFAADAALRIGTDAASIAEGMRELFSLPATGIGNQTTTLSSLGDNGRALVERQFTWPMVAARMKEVYVWVLGGGGKPGCVV